jgi:peptide/nickel transport system substrate-binding protein
MRSVKSSQASSVNSRRPSAYSRATARALGQEGRRPPRLQGRRGPLQRDQAGANARPPQNQLAANAVPRDIAYSIRGEPAEELQHTPWLSLKSTVGQATNWIYFPEQWDPKSPWHDLRVRQAANLALDRDQMNQALFLDSCKINNSIIPESFEYYWQPPLAVYDPAKARELLAAAGFPNGFDAGPFTVDSSYSNMAEAAVDYLQQVGIRCKLVPMERAAFASAYANKKLTSGIFRAASGAFGNTATRLASFIVKGGSNVYGSYPDIDELFPLQADELDPKKRAAILETTQHG